MQFLKPTRQAVTQEQGLHNRPGDSYATCQLRGKGRGRALTDRGVIDLSATARDLRMPREIFRNMYSWLETGEPRSIETRKMTTDVLSSAIVFGSLKEIDMASSSEIEYGQCPCGGHFKSREVEVSMTVFGPAIVLPRVPQGVCPTS